MKILLTIAARGGSKGVKNKNIRSLGGRPLIAYTISQAKAWGKAARIIVTTDSDEIAAVAVKEGAESPFKRPPELATDTAPKLPVLRHALKWCEEHYKESYDFIVDLDPTSPVRTAKDLDNCLALFIKERPRTLFSVVNARKNPYFNMVEQIEGRPEGYVALSKNAGPVASRQSAPKVYEMNASIYFYDRRFLLDESSASVVTDCSIIYVMDDASAHDVDSEIDFEFLEFLLEKGRIRLD